MPFQNPIVAGSDLVRNAIRSPDYLPGVRGWTINRDGSAEFNDVTVRGELYVVDPDGSYVRIYTEDPGDGAIIEIRLPDSAGTTIVPARLRSGTSPNGRPALEILGPDVDAAGAAAIWLGTGAGQSWLEWMADRFYALTGVAEWQLEAGTQLDVTDSSGNVVFQVAEGGDVSARDRLIAFSAQFPLDASRDITIRDDDSGTHISAARGVRGRVGSTSPSGNFGTSDATVLQENSQVFRAGRAYKVSFWGGWNDASGAPTLVNPKIKKTSASGTLWIDFGWQPMVNGVANITGSGAVGYLQRSAGTDLTADVFLTAVVNTGTANHYADNTLRRWLNIEDCGAAADFSDAFDVT